ncbi:MAG: nuclear transport factor 2 family protein [Acidobacteria bacterium]|nr:nuclear transport factor 2 family protein [Acidobacteriota bacterium]
MRFRRLTSTLLFVLAGSLFGTASVASAGPKEEVAAATMKWAQTLGENDPDKDGETKTLPARYSFTFVKEGENWMIVDHHSSAMPAPSR